MDDGYSTCSKCGFNYVYSSPCPACGARFKETILGPEAMLTTEETSKQVQAIFNKCFKIK